MRRWDGLMKSRSSGAVSHGVWFGILMLIVVGNAVALVSYLADDSQSKPASAHTLRPPQEEPIEPHEVHRSNGLAAMERGDYDTAVRDFSAGLRTANQDPNLIQLLSVAQSMRDQKPAQAEPKADNEPTDEPGVDERVPVPSPDPPPRAYVVVVTKPPGLLIEVDGKARDLSPARIAVTRGNHSVVVRQGGRRLARRSVEADGGDVAFLDFDVTPRLAKARQPGTAPDASVEQSARPKTSTTDAGLPSIVDEAIVAVETETGEQATRLRKPDSSPPPPPAIRREDVRRIAAASQPKFRRCYRRAPGFVVDGRVVLELQVLSDGRVADATVMTSSVKNRRLSNCLRVVAQTLRFPPPVGGRTNVMIAVQSSDDR